MEILEENTYSRGSKFVFLRFPDTECELELGSFRNSRKIEVPEDLIHLTFEVEKLESYILKLKQVRIPITKGPIETSNGTRFIFTEDPKKYEIELMQCSD